MDLVACVVPTYGRPETHESLYATFCGQEWSHKLLIVLDESAEPSPFFSRCQDPRVQYVHEPSAKGEVTRIGDVRNRLCELARSAGATLVAHFDDDDHYSPPYLSRMIGRLGDGQIVKLAVFRLLVDGGEAKGTVWQWDVRQSGGQHYGLRGSAAPKGPIEIDESEDPRYFEAMRYGYGFSYVYRVSLWERFPFPEEGTEDYPWVRTLRESGIEVVEVDDFADGCLHVVHEGSAVMVWPQEYLGKGLGAAPQTFRDRVRTRMLGALPGMYELPRGKDIVTEPGVTYQVVAKVARSHTLKSITTRAESWGLTVSAARDDVDGAEFDVAKVPDDYRLIHVMGSAKERMTIPWKTNRLIAVFDSSCVERAWADQPVAGAGVAGFRRTRRVQLAQLSPGLGRAVTQQDCPVCWHYAWDCTFMRMTNAIDGSPHHPSCSRLAGLASTKMERRIQRLQSRRGLPITGTLATR